MSRSTVRLPAVLAVMLPLLGAARLHAASRYASPTGSGTACKLAAPCSLATVLSAAGPVRAGDTVYLRCGCTPGSSEYTIKASLVSSLKGTAASPITVDVYPPDRATPWTFAVINGNTGSMLPPGTALDIQSNYVMYRHLEIYNGPNPLREYSSSDGDDPPGFGEGIRHQGDSLHRYGVGNRIQNCVIHDTAQGISKNSNSHLDEISGAVIYYSGFNDPQLAGGAINVTGHGLYLQHGYLGTLPSCGDSAHDDSNPPTALLTNNVVYGGFYAYQEYGSCGGCAMHKNITIARSWFSGNVVWGGCAGGAKGLLGPTNLTIDRSILVGAQGMAYNGSGCSNVSVTNSVIGKYPEGSKYGGAFNIADKPLACVSQMKMTGNTFYPRFNGWTKTQFPSNTLLPDNGIGPGPDVAAVYPNPSEPGRCEIFVVNGALASSVGVDMSACGIADGASYEVKLAANMHGSPVASGIYHAAIPTVSLPMTGLSVPAALGHYLDGTSWDTGGPSHNVSHHMSFASPAIRAPFIAAQVAGAPPATPTQTQAGTPTGTPTPAIP